jgi:UDP-N-acetylmuramate dehydrogenase
MHIRRAIQKIRSDKLPNPHHVPNVGSFFKNVYVNSEKFSELQRQFVAMPFFQEGDMYKIPTGWLIESIGLKGYSRGGVGVYDKNALVLINQSSVNSRDILSLAEEIHREVSRKFGLAIEIEPEIVP